MTEPSATLKRIVIITPCFNEQEAFDAYVNTVRETLLVRTDVRYEVLLVDDGSTDSTWARIQQTCRGSDRFRAIRLSRNFGSHTAATAGFDLADGDAVAILPADLQDPPEVIVEFVRAWREGAQIVWGKRRTRDESVWRRVASRLFERAIRRWAMPKGSRFTTGSFLLADRRVVDCLRQMRERNRTIFALAAWTGFDQTEVEYDRRPRVAGSSSWKFSRMVRTMYDTFIGFSDVIPRSITILGVVLAAIGFISAIYLVVSSWLAPSVLPGWTTTMVILLIFFGITFLILGAISEYLLRIYTESTRRPLYFIAQDSADPGDD